MSNSVTVKDMFWDAQSSHERGERFEELKEAFKASIARRDAGTDAFVEKVGIIKGMGAGRGSALGRMSSLQDRVSSVTKGLSDAQLAEVQADLDAVKEIVGDLAKDITVASPGNLAPYDLETPAKVLVPRFTPLRNDLPRQRGQGTAREYRRILGYTNAGMGGVADMAPFFSSESDSGTPSFGSLTLRRGQKISYAMDVHTAAYMEMSLSDMVTTKAQFTNLGFEDTRQLSQMALLWAHLIGEEKALLYSRGASATGYSGAVAAPSISVASSSTGGSVGAATYYIKVTAKAGYGESAASSEVNTGALSGSTNQFTVTVTTEPNGALNYNLYVGTSTGTETFVQNFVGNSVVITTTPATGGAAAPSTDSTANANGYDGFLTVLTNPQQAGVVKRLNAPLWNGSTGNGDKAFQDVFQSLYTSVYADPEEAWLTSQARRELADWVKQQAGGSVAYRIQVTRDEFEGGMNIGGAVTGLLNESSPNDTIVRLRVHPYMPAGAAFVRSCHLPIPDSGITDTTAVTAVQEYMSVEWPQIQFTYDTSTYWYGTAIHYAPAWSASILGIQ